MTGVENHPTGDRRYPTVLTFDDHGRTFCVEGSHGEPMRAGPGVLLLESVDAGWATRWLPGAEWIETPDGHNPGRLWIRYGGNDFTFARPEWIGVIRQDDSDVEPPGFSVDWTCLDDFPEQDDTTSEPAYRFDSDPSVFVDGQFLKPSQAEDLARGLLGRWQQEEADRPDIRSTPPTGASLTARAVAQDLSEIVADAAIADARRAHDEDVRRIMRQIPPAAWDVSAWERGSDVVEGGLLPGVVEVDAADQRRLVDLIVRATVEEIAALRAVEAEIVGRSAAAGFARGVSEAVSVATERALRDRDRRS